MQWLHWSQIYNRKKVSCCELANACVRVSFVRTALWIKDTLWKDRFFHRPFIISVYIHLSSPPLFYVALLLLIHRLSSTCSSDWRSFTTPLLFVYRWMWRKRLQACVLTAPRTASSEAASVYVPYEIRSADETALINSHTSGWRDARQI